MPRPVLPPTPGSSTDIQGKDGGAQHLSSTDGHHLAFELPPPALMHDASPMSPTDSSKHAIMSSSSSSSSSSSTAAASHPPPALDSESSPRAAAYHPLQAAETVKSRRRSAAAAAAAAAATSRGDSRDCPSFALPPPPTRSRKIIQMRPRTQGDPAQSSSFSSSSARDSGRAGGAAAANKGPAGTAKTAAAPAANKGNNAVGGDASGAQGGTKKKKQPGATSAAGRKIARKTAHSLIERRRRSKMNEEFALLKSMVPACAGEMHKLAILQASIDYVRYLEDCVSKLQAQRGEEEEEQNRDEAAHSNSLPSIRDFHPAAAAFRADPSGGNVDMSDSDTAGQPDCSPQHALHHHLRQYAYPSVSTDQRHYSFSTSAGASPALGPRRHGTYAQSSASGCSTLTSPALNPQSDLLDQEATAALLMLNNDRRGTNASLNARGLSVRDLLST